jgi:hypothetical protein
MRNRMLKYRVIILAIIAGPAAASTRAADPNLAVPSAVSVQEQPWDSTSGDPGRQLGAARESFLAVDTKAAAASLRKAATQLREASREAAAASKQSLNASADELESLGRRIETRMVHSVEELDRPFARAYHAVAEHHFLTGQRLWRNQEHRQAGWRIRAAADNLERAAATTNLRLNTAGQTVIKDSRALAGKMVRGTGYAVDEVGKTFEALGQQVETVGGGIEKSAAQPTTQGTSK